MVLTRTELVGQLQNEVRILLHLAGKVEPSMLDYRPTAKQRSTIELLRYLSMMGPTLVRAVKLGTFSVDEWNAAEQKASAQSFEATLAAISAQSDLYAALVGEMTDADLRAEINLFGEPSTRGVSLVAWVLCGCAAYRTQLFNYLKACGREELNTMNLWSGVDPAPSV